MFVKKLLFTYQGMLRSFRNLGRLRCRELIKIRGWRPEKIVGNTWKKNVRQVHLGAGLFGRGRDSIRLWSFEWVRILLGGTGGCTLSPEDSENVRKFFLDVSISPEKD